MTISGLQLRQDHRLPLPGHHVRALRDRLRRNTAPPPKATTIKHTHTHACSHTCTALAAGIGRGRGTKAGWRCCRLLPGTVICTGTPFGVGLGLKPQRWSAVPLPFVDRPLPIVDHCLCHRLLLTFHHRLLSSPSTPRCRGFELFRSVPPNSPLGSFLAAAGSSLARLSPSKSRASAS